MMLVIGMFLVHIFIIVVLQECYLVYILNEMSGCTSMVLTRTCDATRFLALMLRHLGHRAIPISGKMSQVISINLTEVKK